MRVPFSSASSPPSSDASPFNARSSVVLPAPFGPASASRSRRSTLNETPSKSGAPDSSLRSPFAIRTAIDRQGTLPAVTSVLALDVGTSSVRAAVDTHEEVQTPYAHGAGEVGAVELADTCLAAIERAGPADVVAISCFWHSLVAIDENGEPLTPVLTWSDVSSAGQAPIDAFARTGCPPHASYWPAKLTRLRAERPDVFERAARFVGFGEYLFERLTGEVRTSLSMASGTGLLDLRTK